MRQASTMPLEPPVEATDADASSIWQDRRDAILSAIRRGAARVQQVAQGTVRLFTGHETGAKGEEADAIDVAAQAVATVETDACEKKARSTAAPPDAPNAIGDAGPEKANGPHETGAKGEEADAIDVAAQAVATVETDACEKKARSTAAPPDAPDAIGDAGPEEANGPHETPAQEEDVRARGEGSA